MTTEQHIPASDYEYRGEQKNERIHEFEIYEFKMNMNVYQASPYHELDDLAECSGLLCAAECTR